MSFTAKSTLSSIPYKPIEGPHMRITWEEEEDAAKYEYSYLSALPKVSGSSLLHEKNDDPSGGDRTRPVQVIPGELNE